MYNLKIACISHVNPRADFMFHLLIENPDNVETVISDINKNLSDCHCELVSVEPENTRS